MTQILQLELKDYYKILRDVKYKNILKNGSEWKESRKKF